MTVGRNVTTNSRMLTVNVTCDTDGQVETLYTCPSNCRSHVSMLHIVNFNGTVTIDITLNRAAATQTKLGVDPTAHILGSKNMSLGDFVQFIGAEMVMEPGDTVKITATGSSPNVDAMLTAEEFFIIPG